MLFFFFKERLDLKDATTDTSHMVIMTDPDCLGPCEPGTSVVLEGIVWQETENGYFCFAFSGLCSLKPITGMPLVSGLRVINVTWRGKTYVGTLLDATKHEWAPPT